MQNRALLSNLSLKVLSVLIAGVLWFIVLGSRNVEVNKDIPVEIITPPDLVVANEVPDKVVFRMSGPKAFLRNVLNRREDPIRINFSNAKPGLTTYRLFQDNIQVPLGVKVLSVNPSIVAVKLEVMKRREVRVKLVTRGNPPAGYNLNRLELAQSTLRIRGPESKVDAISEVSTMPVDLGDIVDSGEKEVALDFSNLAGIRMDGNAPRIRFNITHTTANFKIRNVDVRVSTSKKYDISPKEVTFFVRCSAEELKEIDRSKVYAVIDMKNRKSGVYQETLIAQLPSNIKLIKVSPPKVKVTLY